MGEVVNERAEETSREGSEMFVTKYRLGCMRLKVKGGITYVSTGGLECGGLCN